MKEKSRFFKNIRLRRVCILVLVSFLSASCLGGYFLNGQVMLLGEEGALTLPKGPYQMYVSPGEVLIGAQLPQGTQGSVSYWKAGEKQSKVTVPFKSAWDRIEMARLSGLSPDDKYEIEVNIGQYSTDVHPIVTGIEKGEPFRFLVVGDTKPDRELIHPMLVDQMAKREAAFYIHLGDFVRQGDRVEDWNLFFDIHRPLMSRMPILPVVGNHDTSDATSSLMSPCKRQSSKCRLGLRPDQDT